jgi:hypothetical protein
MATATGVRRRGPGCVAAPPVWPSLIVVAWADMTVRVPVADRRQAAQIA